MIAAGGGNARGRGRVEGGVELRHNGGVKIAPSTHRPEDARTRDRVCRAVLEQGPVTATLLAERLGLTPAAVRRHLDALAADGLVSVWEVPSLQGAGRRGRGRPARQYVIDRPRARGDVGRLRRPRVVRAALPACRARRGRRPGVRGTARRRARAALSSPRRRGGAGHRPAGRGPRRRADRRRLRGVRPPRGPRPAGRLEPRRAALSGALPRPARRARVPRALRGGDGRVLASARRARATPGDARARRARLHHPRPTSSHTSKGRQSE